MAAYQVDRLACRRPRHTGVSKAASVDVTLNRLGRCLGDDDPSSAPYLGVRFAHTAQNRGDVLNGIVLPEAASTQLDGDTLHGLPHFQASHWDKNNPTVGRTYTSGDTAVRPDASFARDRPVGESGAVEANTELAFGVRGRQAAAIPDNLKESLLQIRREA